MVAQWVAPVLNVLLIEMEETRVCSHHSYINEIKIKCNVIAY